MTYRLRSVGSTTTGVSEDTKTINVFRIGRQIGLLCFDNSIITNTGE